MCVGCLLLLPKFLASDYDFALAYVILDYLSLGYEISNDMLRF